MMGLGSGVSRNIHCQKPSLVLALVSLLALSASASNAKGIKPELLSNDDDKDLKRVGQYTCLEHSIVINQGPSKPIPSGIPSYIVEIVNVCSTGCSVYNIRVSCGWFSSATLVNPKVFRRVKYNECIVNDKGFLHSGESVSFHYANSFPYRLSVSSLSCGS